MIISKYIFNRRGFQRCTHAYIMLAILRRGNIPTSHSLHLKKSLWVAPCPLSAENQQKSVEETLTHRSTLCLCPSSGPSVDSVGCSTLAIACKQTFHLCHCHLQYTASVSPQITVAFLQFLPFGKYGDRFIFISYSSDHVCTVSLVL